MVNLDILETMLNNALDAETPESLNAWLDAQDKKDSDCGIIRNADLLALPMSMPALEFEKLTVFVSYSSVSLVSDFNTTDDFFNIAS